MTAARRVEPELLDSLPADDPRAVRSRRDLRRVNTLMSAASLLAAPLDRLLCGRTRPVQLVEIGAGDGTLLLRIARRYAPHWPPVRLGLLDMQPVVDADTLSAYRALGWEAEVIGEDVFDWLGRDTGVQDPDARPVVCANLFVHHFDGAQLPRLLAGIAARSAAFVCIEPRRSSVALLGSRLLGVVGCNDVTRHDAVVSVRAGFSGAELSAQWPHDSSWRLDEAAAGLFSHRFVAVRGADDGHARGAAS